MAVEFMAADMGALAVARIVAVVSALFAVVLILSYPLGIPTSTTLTLPLLFVPATLLWTRSKTLLTIGFAAFAVACAHAAVSVCFIDSFQTGTKVRAIAIWLFLAAIFTSAARLIQLRGIER